jgi:hypothetical protein
MEELKYPIGKYIEQPFSEALLKEWLLDIEVLPKALEYAIINLDAAQLEEPYRPGGWNSRQVVHHVADSHMNAYIRFKLGYTENNPDIKPYEEGEWAVLSDVKEIPINVSITLLYALHARWHNFLKSLQREDWDRTVFHPEHKKTMTLWYLLGNYAWHGKHHTAHINKLRERMIW